MNTPTVQLMQGDCMELMPTITSASVDLVLCDLPYGMTSNKWDAVLPLPALWSEYNRLTNCVVLTAMQPFSSALVMSNPRNLRYEWIWEKENGTGFLNAKKQPLRTHEQILVFYRSQPSYNPQMTKGKPYICHSGDNSSANYRQMERARTINTGTRYPTTVLRFQRDSSRVHPTQKPVALMEYLIRTYTNQGGSVLDNCMGSGTTGVACVMSGRNFIGIEQNPEYFAIAQSRIAEAAGYYSSPGGQQDESESSKCSLQSLFG
jgi:site-specific DNA-methyltransferase (adenine-specific)